MKRPFVFLGGTIAHDTWRDSFTQHLIADGVPAAKIINPVVTDWTPAHQAEEDAAKQQAEICLYYISDLSAYSLVEATMGLYDHPASTVVVFDLEALGGHALQALRKCQHDLQGRFPEAPIFASAADALSYLSCAFRGDRAKEAT